jgi:hypothetical protein
MEKLHIQCWVILSCVSITVWSAISPVLHFVKACLPKANGAQRAKQTCLTEVLKWKLTDVMKGSMSLVEGGLCYRENESSMCRTALCPELMPCFLNSILLGATFQRATGLYCTLIHNCWLQNHRFWFCNVCCLVYFASYTWHLWGTWTKKKQTPYIW